jgi:hypothetical protein
LLTLKDANLCALADVSLFFLNDASLFELEDKNLYAIYASCMTKIGAQPLCPGGRKPEYNLCVVDDAALCNTYVYCMM